MTTGSMFVCSSLDEAMEELEMPAIDELGVCMCVCV